MNQIPNEPDPTKLYPLRFAPVFQYRLWGGRRLEKVQGTPLPGEGPFGEAWILSDRDDFPSKILDGALQGRTLGEVIRDFPEGVMGVLASKFKRFPLLLKYLDAKEQLSVQVHPTDEQKEFLPPGEHGKTEAWVVLEAGPESKIYAGLTEGTDAKNLRSSLADGTVADHLASFAPKVGDGLFIPAGTVHALGGDLVVFEVQENSDVTFRLYDWDRVDATTGKPRELQIEEAIACVNFQSGPRGPVAPRLLESDPVKRERLFECEYFQVDRILGPKPFGVGVAESPRVLVCLEGTGAVVTKETHYPVNKGDVVLLPASLGACQFVPTSDVTVLEIAIP